LNKQNYVRLIREQTKWIKTIVKTLKNNKAKTNLNGSRKKFLKVISQLELENLHHLPAEFGPKDN
jgi:hypothetical protein